MQQNLVQITSIDGRTVASKKRSSKIKELRMLREAAADDSMEWSVLLADEEAEESMEKKQREEDEIDLIAEDQAAVIDISNPDIFEHAHQNNEKSVEYDKNPEVLNHKMMPLSISQRPSSSTKDSSQFKDTLLERDSESKAQTSARKLESHNKKIIDSKIEEDMDEDTAEKNEREGFSLRPMRITSHPGGRIAVPERRTIEKVQRENQSPPLIGGKYYHPPQMGLATIVNVAGNNSNPKRRVLVIKDKRLDMLQESPPIHKSLKITRKEESIDQRSSYVASTSRPLDRGFQPVDIQENTDRCFQEEETQRQFHPPTDDLAQRKMKRDIASAAKINPRSNLNPAMSLQSSMHLNEFHSPNPKQNSSQGIFNTKSQFFETMGDMKWKKESFNISGHNMKSSLQGPEFVTADSRSMFKSFANINTKSRIRLSKLN